jgi:hypothetical protein
MEIFKALNNPHVKQLMDTLKLFTSVLPNFTPQEITDPETGQSCIALLFEHTEENERRVKAIEALLDDILEVEAEPNAVIESKPYCALIFKVPKGAT